jgi:multiple sugar transport system permease protein
MTAVVGRSAAREGRPAPSPVATRRVVATVLKYASLIVATAVVVVPLLVFVFISLKTPNEVSDTSPLTPPKNWFNFHNYRVAFDSAHVMLAFANTAIIIAVSTVATIIIGSMTAYAISRFRFRFKRLVMGAFLVATLVPTITTQVATYQIVKSFGLVDTRYAPIVLYMGTDIVSIYIFLQFIRSIPISLDEAARIDGAGHFRIYRSVILPLLRPAMATVVIIKGVTIYNDFYTPKLYMTDPNLNVVSTSLYYFKGPFGAHWEVLSAGALIIIVPVLLLFLFLQKFIYNGLRSTGAVK